MKEIVIDIPMYGARVVVYVGKGDSQQYFEGMVGSAKEWGGESSARALSGLMGLEERFDGLAAGFCDDLGLLQIMWMEKRGVKVLVHEAMHACINLGAHLGFSDVVECSEFYCYMGGYIVDEVRKNW